MESPPHACVLLPGRALATEPGSPPGGLRAGARMASRGCPTANASGFLWVPPLTDLTHDEILTHLRKPGQSET